MAVHEYPLSHGSLAGLSDTDHHKQYPLLAQGPASSRPTGPWRFGRIYRSTDTEELAFDTGAAWVDFGGGVKLDAAQTWTAAQTFTAVDPAVVPLRVVGAPDHTQNLFTVARYGSSYVSFQVWKDGEAYFNDGARFYPSLASTIGVQIDWNPGQTGDMFRVYSSPTVGEMGLRVTATGEVSVGSTTTSAGHHVAFNQIMSY